MYLSKSTNKLAPYNHTLFEPKKSVLVSEMSMSFDNSIIPIAEGANNLLSVTVDGQFDDAPTSCNTSGSAYEDGRSNDPPGWKMNDLTSQARGRDDVSKLLQFRSDKRDWNQDPPSPKSPPCLNHHNNLEKGESSEFCEHQQQKPDQVSHLFLRSPGKWATNRRSQPFSTIEQSSGNVSSRAAETWISLEGQAGRLKFHGRSRPSTKVLNDDSIENMKVKRTVRQSKKKPTRATKFLRKRKTSTLPSEPGTLSNENRFPSITDYLCAAPIKVDTSDMDDVERLPMLPPVLIDKGKTMPVKEEDFRSCDVLLGRGGRANGHDGNLMFRTLCSKYRMIYCTAPKGHKGSLARSLCNYVRQKGGRFLQKGDGNDHWYECGDQRAFAKCSQALREGTAIMIRNAIHNERKTNSKREAHIVEETETASTKQESSV